MSLLSHPVQGGAAARLKRAMRRLLLPVAAASTAALTAALGLWQLDRAAQKDALHASIEARAQEPALAARQLQGLDQVHRLVQLQGQWLPHSTVFLENRPMGGRAGFFVLTALQLPDGRTVLVQRGWQPRDLRDRTLTQAVPTPADVPVQLHARVAPPPSRLMDFEGGQLGLLRQNIELEGYAAEFRLPALLPISLQQLEPAQMCAYASCTEVLDDGLKRDWTVVGSSADRNRGYAVQWFSLSALVAGLFIWFQWLRPWRRRPAQPHHPV
jgi:surfeit locus 1 family protein